ncbi:dockerin type I domain-containing protein [Ruminococcus sp.]|uniref:dockerin type I domain-containing protein n=1 Tax=Ruminococcus sp. TaxID=41978 RepID=UPI0025ECBE93|nr:dockerin type I domain-containing protein [Ruminococcus sp.]
MKKTISIITSTVLVAGITASFAANAADTADVPEYNPYFNFQVDEGSDYEVLRGGVVFINTKAASSDSISVPCAIYLNDEQKLAGKVLAKWQCEKKGIVLKDLSNPIDNKKYGKAPFSYFNENPDEILLKDYNENGLNIHAVAYSTMSGDPMALTGDSAADYPIACFNAALEKDAEFGRYTVEVISKPDYYSSVTPRYEDKTIIKSVDMAGKCEDLIINVSDRKLGDVNDDGFVDAVDASKILYEYAVTSASGESSMTESQRAASDVDGNKFVDAVDASRVLGFYAYVSSGSEDMTLNSFIKKN